MAVNLAELDGQYEETKPATDGLPPGTYQARIDKAIMKETKDGKYHMLAFELKVVSGPHAGAKAFFNITMTGIEDNLKYVKRDLLKLGYSGPLSQLEAATDTFIDQHIEIQVKTKKDKDGNENTNTYLSKRIDVSQVTPGYDGPEPDFKPPVEEVLNDF